MSKIGTLKKVKSEHGEILVGNIRTLQMSFQFRCYPLGGEADSKDPAYNIIASASDGGEAEIGRIWLKTMTAPERFGEEFYSISIDDPSLPSGLNVAAFKSSEDGVYSITFRRRQTQAAS